MICEKRFILRSILLLGATKQAVLLASTGPVELRSELAKTRQLLKMGSKAQSTALFFGGVGFECGSKSLPPRRPDQLSLPPQRGCTLHGGYRWGSEVALAFQFSWFGDVEAKPLNPEWYIPSGGAATFSYCHNHTNLVRFWLGGKKDFIARGATELNNLVAFGLEWVREQQFSFKWSVAPVVQSNLRGYARFSQLKQACFSKTGWLAAAFEGQSLSESDSSESGPGSADNGPNQVLVRSLPVARTAWEGFFSGQLIHRNLRMLALGLLGFTDFATRNGCCSSRNIGIRMPFLTICIPTRFITEHLCQYLFVSGAPMQNLWNQLCPAVSLNVKALVTREILVQKRLSISPINRKWKAISAKGPQLDAVDLFPESFMPKPVRCSA